MSWTASFADATPASSTDSSLARAERWIFPTLAVVGVLVWFAALAFRSLVHPDEGRYAELSLAMMRSGDWITPRLDGFIYFEKPALQYWLGAIAFHLFGINEFAARFWPGLSGLLTVVMTGYTAARLWGREAGIQATAICASMAWIVLISHVLTLDAGLTFFLTVTLCAVLVAMQVAPGTTSRRNWIWLAWAAMAGAVLSKGLIGIVIPGFVLVATAVWRRDLGLVRGLHWGSGLLLLLALTVPWFVLVSLRNPEFAQFFFIHEHFTRYLTEVHRREGAWWYYLPMLVVGMLPWTTGLPWLLRLSRTDFAAGPVTPRVLLWTWTVFIFLFFSKSGSKLPSYILPVFPALALLAVVELRRVRPGALRRHLWALGVLWLALMAASTQIDRFVSFLTPASALEPLAEGLRWGALIVLLGIGAAFACLSRGRLTLAVAALGFGHAMGMLLILHQHDDYGQLKSAAPFEAQVREAVPRDVPFFSVRTYDQTLPFYLGRDVTLVDYVDEFALGQAREPGRWVHSLDDFIAQWQRLPRAAAYMERITYIELLQRHVPMKVLYEDPRRLVVAKP